MDFGAWLKEWAVPLSAGVTLLAVFVALGIGVASIWNTRSMQKKERRERLLNEIYEWALEIQTNSLTIEIPLSTDSSLEQIREHREANLLLRYGKTFTKNGYIMVIVNKEFKKDLKVEAEEAVNVFAIFLFLKGSSFGMQNAKGIFGGLAKNSIIHKLDKAIKDDPEKLEELLETYSKGIATSLNKLLLKIAEIKAQDIS
jgi:transcription termination factor NusB